ncbi:MAG: CHAP domain-containing protein [Alphaproteobacteria bacterium]|nr:CHAP domain-containing protein [Alphaproteobacteria bacterium]MDE2631474.1 CHAP domain-containing protein [Alphaproteobacteria bacterium]
MPVPVPRPSLISGEIGKTAAAVAIPAPTLNIISADPTPASDTPTFVRSLRRIYCVEFARIRSGINIFGDAKTWWDHAKGQYARAADPQAGAVMVFAGTRKMKLGHVAVVTRVISSREIRVDHANWRRDGNIYLNAPVVDVSDANDWSKVRVFDTRSGQMGSNVYPIKGFVFRTALN